MRQNFKVLAVHITTKRHSAIERLAVINDGSTVDVDHGFAIGILDLFAGVAKVPVQHAVGAKQK